MTKITVEFKGSKGWEVGLELETESKSVFHSYEYREALTAAENWFQGSSDELAVNVRITFERPSDAKTG